MTERHEQLLAAYFADQITDPEREEMLTLLDNDREFRARFNEMQKAYVAASMPAFERSREKDYKRLEARLQPHRNIISLWRPMAIAASIAAVVCLGAALFAGYKFYDANHFLRLADVTTITAARGIGTQTILPDGTRACLNAGSTLTFDRGFGRKERNVTLEGEGYFEVAHNAQKPFRVHAGNACVTVKGTVFNVRGYAEEPAVEVSLLEGSVLLSSPSAEVMLTPGTCGVVSRKDGNISLEEASHSVSGWIKGRIVFSDKSVEEILGDIQRVYGVHFIYEEGLFDKERFTGSISTSLTVDEILSYIDVDHKFTWQRKEDTVEIHKK